MNVGKVYDLAQPLFAGMPHFPTHPPFSRTLTKMHGEMEFNGASSAAEMITLGGHVGTHIDALSHFSCDGKLHGGPMASIRSSRFSGPPSSSTSQNSKAPTRCLAILS